jgi:hypothetical protein
LLGRSWRRAPIGSKPMRDSRSDSIYGHDVGLPTPSLGMARSPHSASASLAKSVRRAPNRPHPTRVPELDVRLDTWMMTTDAFLANDSPPRHRLRPTSTRMRSPAVTARRRRKWEVEERQSNEKVPPHQAPKNNNLLNLSNYR